MTIYFDTSALVKLLVEEAGSDVAAAAWDAGAARASNRLLYPETRAALAQARRAGRLSRAGHDLAVEELDRYHRLLFVVELDAALALEAGHLAASHGLRGYDAVHLASALTLAPAPVTIVSWDDDLRRAAHATGLAISPAST